MHPQHPTQPWPPVDARPSAPQHRGEQYQGEQYQGEPTRPGGSGQPAPAAQPVSPQALTMRASHADRERTVDVLKSAFAEGRLRAEEYNDRVEQVYQAQTYGELAGVVQDLPSGPMPVPYLTPAPSIPPAFAAQPFPAQPHPGQPFGLGAPYPYPYPPLYPYPAPYLPPYGQQFHAVPGYGLGRSGVPGPQGQYPYPSAFVVPPLQQRTNGLAVAALVLGLTELWTMGLTSLPALICGIGARRQIRERGEAGSGMATTGIVLGALGIAFWGLILLLAMASFHSGGGITEAPVPPGG